MKIYVLVALGKYDGEDGDWQILGATCNYNLAMELKNEKSKDENCYIEIRKLESDNFDLPWWEE